MGISQIELLLNIREGLKLVPFFESKAGLVTESDDGVSAIIAFQEYTFNRNFTLNFGFIASVVSRLNDHPAAHSIGECNSSGFCFRPREIGIEEPVYGWAKSSHSRDESSVLARKVVEQYSMLYESLHSLPGWVQYCRRELRTRRNGRGKFWTRIVDAMLAIPEVPNDEIKKALREHCAEPDGKSQNRLDFHIERQERLLEDRIKGPHKFFERYL